MKINIAIDGTAASGKGTIAKIVAKMLGLYNLDTGAMFRAVAYKCVKEKIDTNNEKKVGKILKNIDFKIEFEKDKTGNHIQKNILDGEDLGQKIRTEQISTLSSIISQYKKVRKYTKKLQLELAKKYDIIIEGRDITTKILPKTPFKFFITATPEVRARRRLVQLGLPEGKYQHILEDIKKRDKRDSERRLAPLKVAKDANFIDSSDLSIDETVSKVLKIITEILKKINL